MTCKRKSVTNPKQDSQLFDTLYEIAQQDEARADELFAYFQSEEFKSDFGNWVEDFKKPIHEREIQQRRVNDFGEPRLVFDNKYGKYYYTNKTGQKIYFPNTERKLNTLFSNEAVRSISKMLALNFLRPRVGQNFNELDLSARKTTLRESIEAKIKERVEQLEESGDLHQMGNAMALEDSLEYVDEWVQSVENYFREINLVYKETTESDDMLEEEESERGQTFGVASFERSTKENISANVKLRLALLVDLNELDDIFFEPKFIEFDEVYSTLQGVLTNKIQMPGIDLFEEYKAEIFNLIAKKPYMEELYNQITAIEGNENIKAEFVQAFNLHKNNYLGTIYNIKKKETTDPETQERSVEYSVVATVQNLSEVGAKNRFVKNNWHYNFIKNFTNEEGKITERNRKDLDSTLDGFDALYTEYKKASRNMTQEGFTKYVNGLVHMLEQLGVVTTEEGFNHYLDNLDSLELSTEEKMKNLEKLYNSTKFLTANIRDFKGDLTEINPFDDQVEFNNLAKGEAFFLGEGSDASIFSSGKSRWVYSYPSYLSSKIKTWKQDRSTLLGHYNSSAYNRGSYYMQYLLALDGTYTNPEQISKERIEALELNIFNSLQEQGKAADAVDNKSISINDNFADVYNKMLGFRKSSGQSYVNTPTPADKGTQYQLSLPKQLMIAANARWKDGKVTVNQKPLDILYGYVKAEHERIKEAYAEIKKAEETGDTSKLKVHYHLGNKNGLKFQLLPELNNFDAKAANGRLFDDAGNPLDVDLDTVKEYIMDMIEKTVSDGTLSTYKNMKDAGIIQRKNDGTDANKAIDNQIWNSYSGSPITAMKIAADVFINGVISQVEYAKMFSGDIAYYKNMVDYKKRIPATYTDGLQLYLKEGDEHFNVAVVDGVEVPTPYMDNLVELVGKDIADKYKKINSTDAQAWITPARWEFLLKRLGKWSEAHDVVKEKLENNQPLEAKELKMVAQPLKGVYFEINEGAPVYLKYSQAVLIPQLVETSEGLKKIAKAMETNKVDELITIDGVKVGSSSTTKIHEADGSVSEEIKLNPFQLKNSGWKLQQDLPTKTNKDTEVGSQIQKNIFAGVANNLTNTFMVGRQEMKGNDLITHMNGIVEAMSDQGLKSLMREFDITPDGKINNVDRLNAALVDELKSRGASQNVIDALAGGLSSYGIPGYQQKLQNIFASIALKRLVKIKTNGGSFIQMSNFGISREEGNQKGVKWAPWAKETTHEPEILKDENGEPILSESGKQIVRPGGILLSGSFIAKYVPNYREIPAGQLFPKWNAETKQWEGGMIDYNILNNIIGYRIPNQGLASNDALQVVGILPEGMGDTVVAYTGITTKTGSDFDIDKMYMMMPSYRPKLNARGPLYDFIKGNLRGTNIRETILNVQSALRELDIDLGINEDELVGDVLSAKEKTNMLGNAYDTLIDGILDNPNAEFSKEILANVDIKPKGIEYIHPPKPGVPFSKYKKQQLQNALIESYKAVLTSPDVIKDVMTPIDFDFLKDDVVDLFPQPESTNMSDFDITKEIELKFQFSAGKAGVGQTANALVDHVRGMMADLSLHDSYLGVGLKNSDGETVFDSEYSEELTDAEIKAYVKDYNVGKPKNKQITEAFAKENYRKIKVANSLSALMNAYVDIAKDPYITRGNWTTQTANVGFMLIRAGVHPFRVNAILGQPAIKEYINFVLNSESKISDESGNLQKKFIDMKIKEALVGAGSVTHNEITRSYSSIFETTRGFITPKNLNQIFKTELSADAIEDIQAVIEDVTARFDSDQLDLDFSKMSLSGLRSQIKEVTDPELQNKIFQQFFIWQEQSKNLVQNIKASKMDVTGYGKNTGSMTVTDNLVNYMLANETSAKGNIKGFGTKLERNGKKTLLGAYKGNIIDQIKKVMRANPNNFITANPTVVATFNEISRAIYNEPLMNEQLADKLEKHYYSHMMSGFTPLAIGSIERQELMDEMVDAVLDYRKTNPDNVFLNELDVKVGDNNTRFIGMSNRKKSPSFETDLVNGWQDLMEDNPELANKLVKYSYVTSGFQMGLHQFYTYIPYKWFVDNGLNEYVEQFAHDLESKELDDSFLAGFFKHNVEDSSIVRRVFPSEFDAEYTVSVNGFVLQEDAGETGSPLYVKQEFSQEVAPGVEETWNNLYKLIGYTQTNKPIYFRTEKLGYKDSKGNKIMEYEARNSRPNSIIKANQLGDLNKIKAEHEKFKAFVYSDSVETPINDANMNKKQTPEPTTTVEVTQKVENPFVKDNVEETTEEVEEVKERELVLNTEQQHAVDKAVDFIKDDDAGKYFVIEGKAGTGKTTIAQVIAEEAMKNGKGIIVAALSHKAKGVIQKKFEDADIPADYHSIAGLLGLTMDLETGQFKEDWEMRNKPAPMYSGSTLFIVDEASMVNEEALELMLSKLSPNSKLLFLGDIGQLPPIRTEENPYYQGKADMIGKKSPVFDTADKVGLVTRVRQGEESPILPYADHFWENSQTKNPAEDPVEGDKKNIVTPEGALLFANGVQSVSDMLIDAFTEAVETKNANLIKVVTYRNKTRKGINQAIHNRVFGANSADYNLGELIIFNDSFGGVFENSTEGVVTKISSPKTDFVTGLKYYDITVDVPNMELTPPPVPVLLKSEEAKHQQLVSKAFADAKAITNDKRARAAAYKKAWGLKNAFANIDYGYAITSHKSQGSTYDMVVVDEADIMAVSPISNGQKSESIYTGLTRARNVSLILSSTKVDNPYSNESDEGTLREINDMINNAKQGESAQQDEDNDPMLNCKIK